MKNIAYILISLLVPLASIAQTDEEMAIKGKKIADDLAARNKAYSTIAASFTLTIESRQDKSTSDHEGTLLIKGNKYRLELLDMITYSDGNTVCTYLRNENEATYSSLDDSSSEEESITPMTILGSYGTNYKIRHVGTSTVDDGTLCDEVDLYPLDRASNITRVRLFVAQNSGNIKRVMQQCKDGVYYYVSIRDFYTNKTINDSEFVFNPQAFPGVNIVDLR